MTSLIGSEITKIKSGETTYVSLRADYGVTIANAFVVHFWFNKAFIEPCMRPVLKQVAEYAQNNPDKKLLIVGHTDLAGSDIYNQALSERRARSAYAYLTFGGDRDAALMEWNHLWQPSFGASITLRDSWGTREYQYMLQDLDYYIGNIDEQHSSKTQEAVREFQKTSGLPVTGIVDQATWSALVEQYLAKDPIDIPESHFFKNCGDETLKWLGCGEQDPVRNTQDAWRPNRRTEFLFVKAETIPCEIPQPVTFDLPTPGAVGSNWCLGPGNSSQRCCFTTRQPAEKDKWLIRPAVSSTVMVNGTITFEDGTPVSHAKYALIAPDGEYLHTDEHSKPDLGERPQGEKSGRPIPNRADKNGKFSYSQETLAGIYILEILDLEDPEVARRANQSRSSAKGNIVCLKIEPQENAFRLVNDTQSESEKGQEINVQAGPAIPEFPQLVIGLNDAKVKDGKLPPDTDKLINGNDDAIRIILEQIYERLKTPTGQFLTTKTAALKDAWNSQGAKPLPDKLPAGQEVAVADERWARQVSEMLTLTPYGGPALHYFGRPSDNHLLIAQGIDGREPDKPLYGIIYACEHLATFGVASRGHRFKKFPPPSPWSKQPILQLLNAGSTSAYVVQNRMGGKWAIMPSTDPPYQPEPVDKQKVMTFPVNPHNLICYDDKDRQAKGLLKTAKGLFKINQIPASSTFDSREFGPASVFVLANRPAQNGINFQLNKLTSKLIYINNNTNEETHVVFDLKSKSIIRVSARWKVFQSPPVLQDNQSGAHAGFVLRVSKNPSSNGKFQLLDTGGFGGTARGKGITILNVGSGFHTGNFDGAATEEVTSSKGSPMRGVGVWEKMTWNDAVDLDNHVKEVLQRARPLGLARLVILKEGAKVKAVDVARFNDPNYHDRAESKLIYVSPLLRMYDDDEFQNYAITRYLWSLRIGENVAKNSGVDIMWWLYIPRGPLARAMYDAPRTAKVSEIVEKALEHIKNKKPHKFRKLCLDPEKCVAKVLAEYTIPIIDCTWRRDSSNKEKDGTVVITYKYPQMNKMSRLHFAERQIWDGNIHLPMDKEFLRSDSSDSSDFPPYFLGR